MTRNIAASVMIGLVLVVVAPNARAEIASRAYVDEGLSGKMNTMTIDSEPTVESANLVSSGGVAAAIAAAVTSATYDDTELKNRLDDVGGEFSSHRSMEDLLNTLARQTTPISGYGTSAIMTTDQYGTIQSKTGSFLTNDNIAGNAKIDIGKLNMPTPPSTCNTQVCMLIFYNNQYVWEPITRDNNETVATTGAVNATPTTTKVETKSTYRKELYGLVCDENSSGVNGNECDAITM